jgi:hypothetical protein
MTAPSLVHTWPRVTVGRVAQTTSRRDCGDRIRSKPSADMIANLMP